jgi:hypothetical protein
MKMKKILLGVLDGALLLALVVFGVLAYPNIKNQYFPTKSTPKKTVVKLAPKPSETGIKDTENSVMVKTATPVINDYQTLLDRILKQTSQDGKFNSVFISDIQTDESFLDKDIQAFTTINSPAIGTPAYSDFSSFIDDIKQMENTLSIAFQDQNIDESMFKNTANDIQIKYNDFIQDTQ